MSFSKAKGTGYEGEVVKAHEALGIDSRRQPGSGAIKGFPCDVQIAGLLGECKRSRKQCTRLYKALEQGGADILFLRDDNKKTLTVLPWETWVLILEWLELAKKFPAKQEFEIDEIDHEQGE
jgi:hypothetical protein|tara:strand:+ start:5434 stop:5799 length:366 start_codon:yes stop_codon:yes gene_type:complete